MSLCNVRGGPMVPTSHLGSGQQEPCSFEAGHLGDHSWALEPAEFGRSSAPSRLLVRCGCGLVRTDEDALTVGRVAGFDLYDYHRREAPRICRGCGCVYMLPKQQPPSSG